MASTEMGMRIRFYFKIMVFFYTCLIFFQSCGTIEKRRYSNGWNLNMEWRGNRKKEGELKANKAQKMGEMSDYIKRCEEIKIPLNQSSDNSFFVEINKDGIMKKEKILRLNAFSAKGFPVSFVYNPAKSEIKSTSSEPENDNLGIIAFILVCLGSIMLLIVLHLSLPLFGVIGIISLLLLEISRVLLYVRIVLLHKRDHKEYKYKGFGIAAWVISIIAGVIITHFIWLGFLDLLLP